MALTSKVTRWVELPHEPGARIQIRQLSATQLDEARAARSDRALQSIRNLDGITFPKAPEPTEPEPIIETPPDPLNLFDAATLVRCGIIGWEGPTYDVLPSPETIGDLDEQTRDLIARELVPAPIDEADRKNGSSHSTKLSTAKT